MKSIAVTKPDMGVLPRERLLLSPFGTLAQAFAEELLARAEQEEGAWSRVPLDLLEEGETAPAPAAPANVTLQVDLRLALEALRREGDRTEQRQAAERIVERVLQIQSRREQPQSRPDRMSGPAAGGPRPLTVLGTVRQEFHNDLTQNIHITQSLSQGSNPGRRREPGGLARQAEAFSRRLQILREEGAAFPRETGADQGRVYVSKLPERISAEPRIDFSERTAQMPPEALALLEEQGERAVRTAESVGQAVLHQTEKQLRGLLDEALVPPAELSHRTEPESGETGSPVLRTGEVRKSGAEKPSAGRTRQSTGEQPPTDKERLTGETAGTLPGPRQMTTSARDIRVGPDVRAEAPDDVRQETAGRGEMPAQPPAELSHRTEPEGGETAAPAARTGEARKSGAEKPPSGRIRRHGAGEQRSSGHARQSIGEQPIDKERLTVETAGTLPGSRQMTTLARDIRVGPDVRAEAPDHARAETTGRGEMPSHPTVELSHRTEPEGGETAASAPQTGKSRGSGTEKPSAGHVRQNPEQQPSADKERLTGETAGTLPGPRQMTTLARDIRVGPDVRAEAPDSARESGGEKPSAGRTRQSTGEQPPAGKERLTGETAGTLPGPRQMTTSARNIRVGPEVRTEAPDDFRAERAPGVEMPPQPPVELSHRTEAEGGKTAALQTGEARGSGAGQSPAGRTRRQGAGEQPPAGHARQSIGQQPLADKERLTGETMGTQPGVHRLTTWARDIRTQPGALRGSRIGSGGLPEQAAALKANQVPEQYLPPAEMDLNLPGGAGTGAFPADLSAPRPEIAETGGTRNDWEDFRPEPLTYGPGQPVSTPQTEGGGQPGTEESAYVRSLPDWARRFLQDGPPRGQGTQTMRVARNIASLPQPAEEDSIQWTAPAYRPPEAPMAYREKEQNDQTREAGEVRISDAEIRRAADKVYHMIEERIRRERRRLGF